MATSTQASGAPSKPSPCSQIHCSACCSPQLCPTMPRQPTTDTDSPSTSNRPSNSAEGDRDSSFVRGSRVVYIQSRSRCSSGGSTPPPRRGPAGAPPPLQRSAQEAAPPRPSTPAGPNSESPSRIHAPSPVNAKPVSTRIARGAAAGRSKSVNQSCPVGGPPGATDTVYRIQI